MRGSLPFAAAAAVVFVVVSCREPTQLTVTVTTDAKCSDIGGVSIAIGQLGDALETKPASAVSTHCDATTGTLGSIVIVPSGSTSDEIAFRITAGFGKSVDDCKAPFGQGCIVARRAIRYLPHTPLFVPVKLSVQCNGIPCAASSTCEQGRCVDARVADSTQCESPSGCELLDAGTTSDSSPPDSGPRRDAGPPTALPMVKVGDVAAATGTAQQQHVVFATHSARWWLFYIDDTAPTLLKTRWSTDFSTWTPSASFTLADGTLNEARNFSVAYADLAGTDVVHIATSHRITGNPAADHVRATMRGASISFSTETQIVSSDYFTGGADPDGPVVALAGDAHVFLATGWANEKQFHGSDTVGNMDVFESTSPDDGAASGPITSYIVHSWVPQFVNNRALVPFGAADMLAIWPLADGQGDTSDLSWATSKGNWSTNANLYGGVDPHAGNDWSACGISPNDVHVVRRKTNSGTNDAFHHTRFDTKKGTWSAGQPIPNEPGIHGSGIVLLTNGTKLLLFAIASDAANSIRYVAWDGSQWGTWATLFGFATKRGFLSGSGCGTTSAAAVTWTEGASSPYTAVGAEVTALF